MSDEFDVLRKVLTNKALTISAELDVPIQVPNAPFVEPQGPWINFWFKLGDTGQAELGGPSALEITVGLIQFDVLVPEQTGDGVAIRLANQIKKKINRKQWIIPPYSYVNLQAASIETNLQANRGWYRACVDAVIVFHHRDLDAEDFED